MPAPPTEYLLFQYRQRMRISYADMLATPWFVIQNDIAMMNLEIEYQPRAARPEAEEQ